jgi:hypothetical protein
MGRPVFDQGWVLAKTIKNPAFDAGFGIAETYRGKVLLL